MRTHTKLFTLFVMVLVWLSGCVAKNVVTRVHPKPITNDARMNGVFYALPRTVVQVDVPVTKKEEKKGKFWLYADCFFPDEKVIKTDNTTFSIGAPTFAFRGEPDSSQVFMIKIPGNYFEDKTLLVDLTAEGVMTKGEASSTNHGLELATNAIKTFVPILSSFATGGAKMMGSKTTTDLSSDFLTPRQKWCLCNLISPPCSTPPKDFKGVNTDLDEAIEAYRAYLLWQRERDNFITGLSSAAWPRETFELMLKEIDARIASIKNLFMGSSSEKSWTGRFEFAPQRDQMSKKLFDYIENLGICTVDYSGLNVLDEKFRNSTNCTDSLKKSVMLRMTTGRNGQSGPQFSDQVSAANLKQTGERGFYYRIPAMTSARVTVEPYAPLGSATQSGGSASTSGVVDKGHDNILIAQLGETVSLPASSNGRTTKYSLSLDAASGAMKNFVLGSDALIQGSEVTDIGTAANSIVDARNKRKQADAAASDELSQLERKRKILEETLKIKDAEEKLGKPNP